MNVILFQNQFEAPILAGTKEFTIRRPRRDGRPRAKEDEPCSLRVWTGAPYRSKQREFARGTIHFTFPVQVHFRGVRRTDTEKGTLVRDKMAKGDGFPNWTAMREFFKSHHGLPFDGVLIKWKLNGAG